ncbi:MAG: tRNA (guanine-N(1)-)-methyltransferase [Herpetosiphonaceae bacterium]|nr:MAG: tRNA (guanine-N(1)-)-methyltransferase [Herpetosiphonaceae bacterium]
MMRFDILTLFPEMFQGPLSESILKRAQQAGLLHIHLHDIRDYTTDRHRSADDYPYGGGAGMVLKPEPLARCLEAVLAEDGQPDGERPPVVLLTPAGRLFTQAQAQAWARQPRLILICGHYEGVDERFIERYVSDEVSIGDYVLTGGELAAMVVVDAVGRLVPGVLDLSSLGEESHDGGLLEYPQYTRPANWRGSEVPPVLLSGHHAEIARWRHEQRLRRTLERRPDLLKRARLSERDREILRSWGWQPEETSER